MTVIAFTYERSCRVLRCKQYRHIPVNTIAEEATV